METGETLDLNLLGVDRLTWKTQFTQPLSPQFAIIGADGL
jgi:hypothetical protein